MLTIDGSQGEGGGQILRTSLALSLCTREPFRIRDIRAARKKPGLRPQHLAAVRAAAAISDAATTGAEPGSRELTFRPGPVRGGRYEFDVGTAGSTTLVLQTVLPPLLTAGAASRLEISGGTHNPFAPPFEFLAEAFLPLVNRLGPSVALRLERPGFYPAGGGRLCADVEPASQLAPLALPERGAIVKIRARAIVSRLPRRIAERELAVLEAELGLAAADSTVEEARAARGPGNVALVVVASERVTEVFAGFGRRGVRAEDVAGGLAREARRYLDAGVPVGERLADQLLLPLALAGAGEFLTLAPSTHTQTNAGVIEAFTGSRVRQEEVAPDVWRIALG